jgi:hypothetical protein
MGKRGRRCADAWDLGSTGHRPREGDEEVERGRLTGGSSLSGPPSTLVTRTARAPWPEPVSVRRRGTSTGDHRRLIDGTEKTGEIEKEVRRGNSPWVGQERWRGCA